MNFLIFYCLKFTRNRYCDATINLIKLSLDAFKDSFAALMYGHLTSAKAASKSLFFVRESIWVSFQYK